MYGPNSELHSDQNYQEAAKTADKTFEVLRPSCPQLTAVVFRIRQYVDVVTWSFVRSKQDAQAKFLGFNVAPHVIKAHEPCSDMLDPEGMTFD